MRERYGSAFEGFIRDKVVIVGGDIGETNLGYTEEEAQRIADDIDVVINSAGNVTFNPTLESALRTNVVGTQNVIAFSKRMRRPALVHVSTCFVAGNRSGAVWESDPVVGYFPRREELEGVEFSPEQEIKDCAKLSERVRDEARDAMMVARFRELARKRLLEDGRDPDDPDAMGLAVARERKVWTITRLLTCDRAPPLLGLPNIYTSQSLGDRSRRATDICSPCAALNLESALRIHSPLERSLYDHRPDHLHRASRSDTIPANETDPDSTPVDQSRLHSGGSAHPALKSRCSFPCCHGGLHPNDIPSSRCRTLQRKHFRERDRFRLNNESPGAGCLLHPSRFERPPPC